MTEERTSSTDYRKRAEARMKESPAAPRNLSPQEIGRLIHELEVHQIELEMQNDELRAAQEGLEASRHQFADLYDFAPVGYVTLDEIGRILQINLTGAGQLGLERKWLIKQPFDSHILHQDHERFGAHLQAVFKTQIRQTCEIRIRRRVGNDKIPFETRLESIFIQTPEGQRQCRTALTDIEEVNRLQRALQHQNRITQTIIENTVSCLCMVDSGGYPLFVNPAFEQVTGYRFDELKDRPIHESIHHLRPDGSIYPTADCPIERAAEALDWLPHHEDVFVRKDGTFFPVRCSVAPAEEDGRAIGTVVEFRDITREKQLDQELLKTQKLESIGLLAGGIAHDFNNLLTALVGNLYLMKSSLPTDHKAFQRAVEAEKTCLRATSLTQQLLTFSRGGAPIKKTIALAGRLEEWVSFALGGSKSGAQWEIAKDLWPVDADEGQLQQVISNLVINAQQAMPTGGTLTVTAANLVVGTEQGLPLPDARYVRIAIRDQGTGIAPEHLPKIFDPFFTTKPKGSGLGLTTSYSIIRRHGGHVSVKSDLGVGTTVSLYLPASSERAPMDGKEEAGPFPVGHGKILLMDDESAIRDMVGETLTHAGFSVVCVEEGRAAIERYREALSAGSPFDAVILDLTIVGGMGGTDAITQLLTLDPYVKAIVSSGYSNDPAMAHFEKHGFAGRIGKPYKIEDLLKLITRLLGRRQHT
ncbi:MAG: ATP-binding protein [Nitrospiria bacterium]